MCRCDPWAHYTCDHHHTRRDTEVSPAELLQEINSRRRAAHQEAVLARSLVADAEWICRQAATTDPEEGQP